MIHRSLLLSLVPFLPGVVAGAEAEVSRLSTESLLTLVQKQTFRYFWEGAEPRSGMALERVRAGRKSSRNRDQKVATGGSGFGLSGGGSASPGRQIPWRQWKAALRIVCYVHG